jgi:hypothetical protein
MKNSFWIMLVLMQQGLCGFAQGAEISLKAGLSQFTRVIGEPVLQFENKFSIGFLTGVNADIPVVPKMTIQSELQYAMFGSAYNPAEYRIRYKTNYLLLPVMLKYSLDNGLSFLAGPQAGILVSAKASVNGERYSMKEEMRKMDFFLVAGIEYRMRDGIRVGMRYHYGMMQQIGSDRNKGVSLDISYRLRESNHGF